MATIYLYSHQVSVTYKYVVRSCLHSLLQMLLIISLAIINDRSLTSVGGNLPLTESRSADSTRMYTVPQKGHYKQ